MRYYGITLNDDYLAHYGVKGQKWGVRRYQNSDGTWKKAGLHNRQDNRPPSVKKYTFNSKKPTTKVLKDRLKNYTDKIKEVYNSLSDEDKFYLNTNRNDDYERIKKYSSNKSTPIYGKILMKNNKPIGFIDVHKDYSNQAKIDIAIKQEHRGKGLAKSMSSDVKNVFTTNPEIKYLDWVVHENNVGSIKIAQQLGFENWGKNDKGFYTYTMVNKQYL